MDWDRYRRIGEEHTRMLEFEPGRLYVKETVRPKYGLKDNLSLPGEGECDVIMLRFHLLLFTNVWSVSTMLAEMLLLKYEYQRSILQAGQGVPPSGCPSFRKHTDRLVQACV